MGKFFYVPYLSFTFHSYIIFLINTHTTKARRQPGFYYLTFLRSTIQFHPIYFIPLIAYGNADSFVSFSHPKHRLIISITTSCCSGVILLSLGRHRPRRKMSAPTSTAPVSLMYALLRARPHRRQQPDIPFPEFEDDVYT